MRGEDRLLELQEVDSSIARLEARAAELESGEDVRAARAAAERAESRVGELRLAMDAIAREQRALERDIETLEAKRVAEEKRMYDGSIVNQKELEALQHEIAGVKERRSRLEDDVLRRMERFEELEVEVAGAEGELAGARTRFDVAGGKAAEELASIRAELDALRGRRDPIAREIDPELLSLYDELRRTKKGVGVAAIVDGSCQGCHQAISAVELNKLKHGDGIKRCEHCRRILVFA
jgi:predicted  nucleic acid-binding Zn-ribbon protein